jgi:hypothetical protein
MSERTFAFFGEYGVSVAMDTRDADEVNKNVTLAFAFCNKTDEFRKDTARSILNERLNSRLDDSGFAIQSPYTFQMRYDGDKSRNDIFKKIISTIHDTNYNVYRIVVDSGAIISGMIAREDNEVLSIDTGIAIVPLDQSNIISRKLLSIRRNVDKINRNIREAIRPAIKSARTEVLV